MKYTDSQNNDIVPFTTSQLLFYFWIHSTHQPPAVALVSAPGGKAKIKNKVMPPYRPSNSLCTRVSVFDGCWNMGFFQAQHLSYWQKVGEREKKKGVDLSLSLKWISLWMAELFITLCHHIWLLKKFNFQTLITPAPSPSPSPETTCDLITSWKKTCLSFHLWSVPPVCLEPYFTIQPAVLPSLIALHCLCTDLVRQSQTHAHTRTL